MMKRVLVGSGRGLCSRCSGLGRMRANSVDEGDFPSGWVAVLYHVPQLFG